MQYFGLHVVMKNFLESYFNNCISYISYRDIFMCMCVHFIYLITLNIMKKISKYIVKHTIGSSVFLASKVIETSILQPFKNVS
jgi:hypothetical protein